MWCLIPICSLSHALWILQKETCFPQTTIWFYPFVDCFLFVSFAGCIVYHWSCLCFTVAFNFSLSLFFKWHNYVLRTLNTFFSLAYLKLNSTSKSTHDFSVIFFPPQWTPPCSHLLKNCGVKSVFSLPLHIYKDTTKKPGNSCIFLHRFL